MSKHLFGLIVTPYGAAANNRGENEGNITTLQKLLWKGEVCTTVSAEAIRWALRYYWQRTDPDSVNRFWNDETSDHQWRDQAWLPWTSKEETDRAQETFIDDDVLGFMLAEAASADGNDILDAMKADQKTIKEELNKLSKEDQKTDRGKELKQRLKEVGDKVKVLSEGKTDKRRGALEVTRAISLSQFVGDLTFNAKSGKKGNTSLYGTELHATRYQYGIALTPESLRVPTRTVNIVDAIVGLCEVAGNQSRFLYDFAPDSLVFRWTDDFAPRILYGFDMDEQGNISFPSILEKVRSKDIDPHELLIGGAIVKTLSQEENDILKGAFIDPGIKATANELKSRIQRDLKIA